MSSCVRESYIVGRRTTTAVGTGCENIADRSPVKDIIKMARQVTGSGITGRKATKSDAEGGVAQAIGDLDKEFTTRYGVNYWTYLKSIFNEYAASRGLDGEMVVRGYPFNFMTSVDTKCSTVMLRKNYHRGEHLVEPEIFLEVGVIRDGRGRAFTGVTFGYHFLYGADGNRSRFIQGVIENPGLEHLAEKLRNSLVVRPEYFLQLDNDSVESKQVDASWLTDPKRRARDCMDTSMLFWVKLAEDEVGADLKERVFAALDEIMPFFKALCALPESSPEGPKAPGSEPVKT